MGLLQNLSDFKTSITELSGHITFIHQKYRNGSFKHQVKLREFVAESAFLKIYIAWETFLEKSFIDYLINEVSINNNRPAKFANPIDTQHANDLIIGTQKYMDWSNPESIRKISKIFFHQGYVFDSTISGIFNDLTEMKVVRNSAAHLSSSTSAKLDGLANRVLNTTNINYSAYKFLFSNDPRSGTNQLTVLEKYITILDIAAEQIANG